MERESNAGWMESKALRSMQTGRATGRRPAVIGRAGERTHRAIFARAGINEQEVRTLRGVITALSRGRGRVLAKLAAQKAAKEAVRTEE